MRCRSVLTRIDALRTGELPAQERGVLDEHLRTCRSCDASYHDVGDLARVMKALTVEPPRSCRDAVKEKCADSFDRIDGADVWVAFTSRGLRMIHRGGSESDFRASYAKKYERPLERTALPDRLRKQVLAAIEGNDVDQRQVDFGEMGELETAVLRILSKIPRGEVRTYAWVARQAGKPRAVRAVGSVCANNAVPFVVPCHRVVPSTGGVGEYAFGPKMKRELLRREGVDVDALDRLARRGIRLIGSATTKIACFPTCRDARRIREENRVPFRSPDEALTKGFRPCRHCQPFAA